MASLNAEQKANIEDAIALLLDRGQEMVALGEQTIQDGQKLLDAAAELTQLLLRAESEG